MSKDIHDLLTSYQETYAKANKKPRVNLAFQENPNCQPFLLLELLQDMGMGLNRIVLECEKPSNNKIKIIDEPIWTLFCN